MIGDIAWKRFARCRRPPDRTCVGSQGLVLYGGADPQARQTRDSIRAQSETQRRGACRGRTAAMLPDGAPVR